MIKIIITPILSNYNEYIFDQNTKYHTIYYKKLILYNLNHIIFNFLVIKYIFDLNKIIFLRFYNKYTNKY